MELEEGAYYLDMCSGQIHKGYYFQGNMNCDLMKVRPIEEGESFSDDETFHWFIDGRPTAFVEA